MHGYNILTAERSVIFEPNSSRRVQLLYGCKVAHVYILYSGRRRRRRLQRSSSRSSVTGPVHIHAYTHTHTGPTGARPNGIPRSAAAAAPLARRACLRALPPHIHTYMYMYTRSLSPSGLLLRLLLLRIAQIAGERSPSKSPVRRCALQECAESKRERESKRLRLNEE